MKKIKQISLSVAILIGLGATIFVSCERSVSGDAEFATFSKTGEIFTDNFIGMGADFYFPFIGAKPDVFSVDENEGFESESSIRIDVPNANDPAGGFAGANFVVDGSGRNLTEFDALTFWARASQAVTIGSAGFAFGEDFQTARNGLDLTTNWKQFVIPIPDPSKLVEVKSVFAFSAGGILPGGATPNQGQEVGYTFWIDELKFEKLGTVAQPRPAIANGFDASQVGFNGAAIPTFGYTQTFNISSGENVTVNTTARYFTFSSSNPSVATANEEGTISLRSAGTATITATLAGVKAQGSFTIESLGDFETAPTPTVDASDVVSIFSDAYNNVPAALISNFGSAQSSTLSTLDINGDMVLNYQTVNFFGIIFNDAIPTIDGSEMTTLHLDILVPGGLNSGASLNIALRNVGPNGIIETNEFTGEPIGDDTEISTSPGLISNEWISVDFDVTGLADRRALGQIVFVAAAEGPSNFYVDNIYFYKNN